MGRRRCVRQWLEIRYPRDSVPDEEWPAVVFTLVTLLDDPVAADLAVDVRSKPVAGLGRGPLLTGGSPGSQ